MKKVLISSYDMSVGGVERSLISLLEHINYYKYDLDLSLFRHQGEFMHMIPKGPNLQIEIPEYSTFRKSISDVIKEGYFLIAASRIAAKYLTAAFSCLNKINEAGYFQMQLIWKMTMPFLPQIKKEYDVAISYLWPHYFVGKKVKAKIKIAWIHTDYSSIEINRTWDAAMWNQFDWIVAVSESCRTAFLKIYPQFNSRTVVIENIFSTDLIRRMAESDTAVELEDNNEYIKLITVARLSHAKGIDNAVKACRKLIDEGYHIKWYVVGYGGDEAQIKELIQSLDLKDQFILLGKKTNPYPYIKASDIYVQPSRYEGKAITVTEAQILAKPVVCTSYTTAKSQVENEVDGYICPMGVDGIIEGVRKLIDDEGLRKRILTNVNEKDYGNENEIQKLYKLIEGEMEDEEKYTLCNA